MSNDDEVFKQEMADVKPLKVEARHALKRDVRSKLAIDASREAATAILGGDDNPLSDAGIDLLDQYYPLEFKRPGVQNGVFRRLKQGKYSQDGRLDLHKMTVEQARKEVYSFIREAVKYDLRSVIIVHGKGQHSGAPLLKSYLNKWLPELESVLAFCSAQPQHGGVGAVYVMLAKSEAKKQENRDKYNR
jgi:DNA-nicking Smr family endonuclease